jgi:hypothetical protein
VTDSISALAQRRQRGLVRDAGAGTGVALVAADARGEAAPRQHFSGDTRGRGGKQSDLLLLDLPRLELERPFGRARPGPPGSANGY